MNKKKVDPAKTNLYHSVLAIQQMLDRIPSIKGKKLFLLKYCKDMSKGNPEDFKFLVDKFNQIFTFNEEGEIQHGN